MSRRWGRTAATCGVIAAVYFSTAKLGLSMAFVSEQVTAVWPPTGLSLAAVVLLGFRVWPGVALGAFLANATAGEPVLTACGIAAGNTLEAVCGAWLLRRLVGFQPSLTRLKDALGLVVPAALVSTMVSATIGATSLCLGGVQPWARFDALWRLWWLGDAVGAVVVAPLLLTWATDPPFRWPRAKAIEGAVLALALVAASLAVFFRPFVADTSYPLVYVIFPIVMWGALRLGPTGSATATFVASAIAIWGTLRGAGPFAAGKIAAGAPFEMTAHESLILLQAFMGVIAATGLVIAATTADRNRALDKLTDLNETLEDRVALRSAELEQRNQQLRALALELTQAEQRERRRLAQVLHDHLQQLLVAAKMQVERARDFAGKGPADHLGRVVELLKSSIDVSRSLAVELSPPVLHEAGLAAAVEWLARSIDKEYALAVDVQAERPVAEPDADVNGFLYQAVRELLFNVVKHAHAGQARIRLANDGGGRLRIAVEDDGDGFDPALLQQPHADHFGLIGIRERIEHLGGAFDVTAAAGRGTRAVLTVPVPRDGRPSLRTRIAPLRPSPTDSAPADADGRCRLLLVDDHQIVRQGLKILLEDQRDMEVVGEAGDGEEAVRLAGRLRPDVILMDVNMPGMTGIEATRRIKAADPGVIVIGLSFRDEQAIAEAMERAGASFHVTKDGPSEELCRLIRSCRAPAPSP
ncbi:MAG: MASE1 domain-containing protein [Planctomycetales bacterium]